MNKIKLINTIKKLNVTIEKIKKKKFVKNFLQKFTRSQSNSSVALYNLERNKNLMKVIGCVTKKSVYRSLLQN
jgi:hypothetical protein